MSQSTLHAAIDTFSNQDQPNSSNFGQNARLRIRKSGSSHERIPYVHFGTPWQGDSGEVTSATLQLYCADTWAAATVTAKRITSTWKETTLTYNSSPTVGSTTATSASVSGAAGTLISIDVTTIMQQAAGGNPFYGFQLTLSVDADRLIWSGENPDVNLRPTMLITWYERPEAPENLNPAGSMIVSATKPVLQWEAGDDDEDAQTESQVRVSTAATVDGNGMLTTSTYDSGMVANPYTEWDLSATAFTALSNSDVRFWQVRVKTGGTQTSEWATPVRFERQSPGTLSITSPGAGGTVDERTPPISWTFSGRTQERADVLVEETGVALGDELYSWTQIVDTETSVTVPGYLGLKSNHTYKVTIRVFDTLDRASSPYVEATRDFTYVHQVSPPASVSGLVATSDGPLVHLEWSRGTQPDFWQIRIDGEEINDDDEIPGNALTAGGSDYEIDVYRGRPGTTHDYEVEAVVNKKHSSGPVVTATIEPLGIWLVEDDDMTDPIAVEIRGTDQPDFTIRETSEVFDLLGQRRPIRITDKIGGYGGTVTGMLLSKQERNQAEIIKGRMGTTRRARLVISDYNFPVILGEMSLPPTPDPQGRYNISFEFDQAGEWTFNVKGLR